MSATEAQSIVGHNDCQHSILWVRVDKLRKVNDTKGLAIRKFFRKIFSPVESHRNSSKELRKSAQDNENKQLTRGKQNLSGNSFYFQ
jgi:hypothetical protein